MRAIIASAYLAILSCLLSGCAMVDGEVLRTSSDIVAPKPKDSPIEVYFSGTTPPRAGSEVGRVSVRALVLEKGIEELKNHARQLGADAVVNVRYDRRFSGDYAQDLFFIDGEAVVWK